MQRLEKTRAFLTEFIIVILFFTISAVITVQLFVASNKKSTESISVTKSLIMAEDIAEKLTGNIKENGGDGLEQFITGELNYIKEEKDGCYYKYFDKEYNVSAYEQAYIYACISIEKEQTEQGDLYNITVEFKDSKKTINSLKFTVYGRNI